MWDVPTGVNLNWDGGGSPANQGDLLFMEESGRFFQIRFLVRLILGGVLTKAWLSGVTCCHIAVACQALLCKIQGQGGEKKRSSTSQGVT